MYLNNLFPTPKFVCENSEEQFRFGASVQAVISGLNDECVKRVKVLWNRFSCTASDLNVLPASDGFRFVIGSACADLKEGDSYAIHTDEGIICL